MLGPQKAGWVVCYWMQFVKQLCSKKKEEIRYSDSKDQTCPKELNIPNQQEID